jgi:hypothetical protein
MKKSSYILLTLMGAIVLSNIQRQPDVVRDVYNNREDCLHDYGDNQCREGSGSGHGGSSGRWYGPDYREDSDTARRGNRATGRETVQRGGFGFSGRRAGGS